MPVSVSNILVSGLTVDHISARNASRQAVCRTQARQRHAAAAPGDPAPLPLTLLHPKQTADPDSEFD